MSTFTKNSVTVKGAVAIAALISGGTLEFTRISVGDGNIPAGQTAMTMTDLSHRLFDVDITEVYSDSESQATVIGVFNNSQTSTGFYYRELGLFAKDPATGAEILYCYGNAEDQAEWISPAGEESVIEKEVHIVTLVGNATEVTATLKSGVYITNDYAAKTYFPYAGGTITGNVKINGTTTLKNSLTAENEINANADINILGTIKSTAVQPIQFKVDAARGTAPAENKYSLISFVDNSLTKWLASLQYTLETDNNASMGTYVANPLNNEDEFAGLWARWSNGSAIIGVTHHPAADSNDYSIVTTGWANGKYLKLTGGTVNGAVTVNGNLTTEGDKIFMKHKTMPAARSTEPAADVVYYAHLDIMNSGGFDYYTNRMGKFEYSRSAGLSRIYMQANNPTSDSTEQGATIGVGWRKNSSGVYEAYTQTLTPPVGDNSTQIATTAWVKALRSSETEYGLVRLASESDVLQETDKVVMDVPLAYELNDFRRMNKAYSVGDKVNCAFRFEWFLECIQAGTTSNETLDTRNVTFGQTITDGTVKWVVRSHVKSVNGQVPDKNGNISITLNDPIQYKSNIGSLNSIKGSFWFDDHSGVSSDCIPSELSGYDWTGLQFGTRNGYDKIQFIFNGAKVYYRYEDNGPGDEIWTKDSWRNFNLFELFTTKGGTLTGELRFNSSNKTNAIKSTADSQMLVLNGGGEAENGGGLWLYGQNTSNSQGCFRLRASNTNGYVDLVGNPKNKALYWGDGTVPSVKTDTDASGYIKLRTNSDGSSLVFAWGTFTNVQSLYVEFNLPCPIKTLLTGWVNPTGSNANTHMRVVYKSSTKIQISGGVGEEANRSGNWGIIAVCDF